MEQAVASPLEAPSAPPVSSDSPAQLAQPPLPPAAPRPSPTTRASPNPHCQAAALQAAQALANAQVTTTGYSSSMNRIERAALTVKAVNNAALQGARAALEGVPALKNEPAGQMMPGFLPSASNSMHVPMLPMQQQQASWDGGWPVGAGMMQMQMQQPDVAPISQMLYREGDAWRALLSLHGSVMNLARGMATQSMQESAAPELLFDETREASELREAGYMASIGQLMSQCDLLVVEAIKIRGLRKAKHQVETQALKEVLRTHANEVLATGEALGRNSALTLASVTSEMRQAAQAVRTQIQQARGLLQASAELRSTGPMPPDAIVVMGWQTADGNHVQVLPVATVLEHVYQRGQLTDENLCAALWEGPLLQAEAPAPRTFARRAAGDRAIQQQLVAGSGTPGESA